MDAEKKYESNPRLLFSARAGDADAEEELVRNNLGLVRSVAARFSDRGYDREELTDVGLTGLLKAIRTFDPARGCAFSTSSPGLESEETASAFPPHAPSIKAAATPRDNLRKNLSFIPIIPFYCILIQSFD